MPWAILAVLSFISIVQPASTQGPPARPDIPLAHWLAGPDHRDFAWKVQLSSPGLNLQQRYVVTVRATLPAEKLEALGGGRHLHFFVKVADEQGRWFDDEGYQDAKLPPRLDKHTDIVYSDGFYARPGKYRVAVIAYDSVEEQWNLWHKEITVPAVKSKALPQLDRDLPRVEFVRELLPEKEPAKTEGAGELMERHTGPWALGHGREWLPVRTERPLAIDLVVNFSATSDAGLTNTPSPTARRANVNRLLQMASVLSHLELANGCVQVSALEVGRVQVMRERVVAAAVDWNDLGREILTADQNTIDVSTLQARTKAASFLRDYLDELIAHPARCEGSSTAEQHVLIVMSNALLFAHGTDLPNPVLE